MGVTIEATNSKYSFDMSYAGFFRLRAKIAEAIDPEFGKVYADYKFGDHLAWKRNNEEVINRKQLDIEYEDVLDFLYMCDCGGKISYKTCKQIYNLIKDKDYEANLRYAAYYHDDWNEFKAFLKECYSKRRQMRWW